jgi:hypothetical protein
MTVAEANLFVATYDEGKRYGIFSLKNEKRFATAMLNIALFRQPLGQKLWKK